MKLIASMSGVVALRVPIEDVIPEKRLPVSTLVQLFAQRYGFTRMSEATQQSPIIFENGKVEIDGREVPINLLQLMQGGDIVYSTDTDTADAILDEMVAFMVAEHGYRFSKANPRRCYLSSVVVEFENELKNVLSSLSTIENVIGEAAAGRILKRLAFGLPDPDPGTIIQTQQSPLDAIERAEFLIERRVGSNPSSNRYFCVAPLRTREHVALLEKIEATTAHGFLSRATSP